MIVWVANPGRDYRLQTSAANMSAGLRLIGGIAAMSSGTLAIWSSLPFTSRAEAPAANQEKHKVLVVGGGTGGVTVAAQLLKRASGQVQVMVVEPKRVHYYQPLWTMIGGHLGYTCTQVWPAVLVLDSLCHSHSFCMTAPKTNMARTTCPKSFSAEFCM